MLRHNDIAFEERPVQVLKRDGSTEEFSREKLLRSLKIACAKRPVSAARMEAIADAVEEVLARSAGVEVPSERIGADGYGSNAPAG